MPMRTMLFSDPLEMIVIAKWIMGKWYIEGKKDKKIYDLSLSITSRKTFCPDMRYLSKLSRLPKNGTRRDDYVKAARTLECAMMILQENISP